MLLSREDEWMTIDGPNGPFDALIRRPADAEGANPRPAVVLIQEIFGVNHTMRQVADDLAASGFYAVAPDLFHQFASHIELDDRKPDELKQAFDYFPKFDVDKGVADVKATVEAVRGLPGLNGRVGAVGYCLGGLLAFLSAERTDADAVVSYYGVHIQQFLGDKGRITHPLMLHIAGEDKFVPPEAQDIIEAELRGVPNVEVHRYRGRDHAFARRGGDSYHAEDASLADQRTQDFLRQHLAFES